MKTLRTPVALDSIAKVAERVRLALCHLVIWAFVPLLALWPAGDPHPDNAGMFLAVHRGDLAAIDENLRRGVDVDSRDDTGITPLMAAVRTGHLEIVRKFLAAGAWIDACAPVFGTPLMVAVINRRHDVMRELVERGANVDAVNPTGQTALWYARMRCDEEATRILIAAGACAEGCTVIPEIER